MDVQGKWTGVIVYDKVPRSHRGKEVYFEMDIYQDGGQISGEALDTGGVGVNSDPATINGTINDKKIAFVKRYSSLHYFQNGKSKVDKSRKGYEIFYLGEFDEQERMFKGEWTVSV